MIIKFTKDTEVEGRLYLAGQSHDFSHATAERLIDSGAAIRETTIEYGEKKPQKEAETASNVDSSTLTITDLDGEETVVTVVTEPAQPKRVKKVARSK